MTVQPERHDTVRLSIRGCRIHRVSDSRVRMWRVALGHRVTPVFLQVERSGYSSVEACGAS